MRRARRVRLVLGLSSCTTAHAGGIDGRDEDLLRAAGIEDRLLRLDLDARDGPRVRPIRRSLADPALQALIGRCIAGNPSAAAVRNLGGRLSQQQTVRRCRRENTTRPPLPRDGQVIRCRVETENAQLKAVLALRLAVAATGIAPCLVQDGKDLLHKGQWAGSANARHLDLKTRGLRAVADDDFRLAVGPWPHQAVPVHGDNLRWADLIGRLAREIDTAPVILYTRDQQLLRSLRTSKHDSLRTNPEFRPRWKAPRPQAVRSPVRRPDEASKRHSSSIQSVTQVRQPGKQSELRFMQQLFGKVDGDRAKHQGRLQRMTSTAKGSSGNVAMPSLTSICLPSCKTI